MLPCWGCFHQASPGKVKRALSDIPVAFLHNIFDDFDDEGHLENFFENILVPRIIFSFALPLNYGYQKEPRIHQVENSNRLTQFSPVFSRLQCLKGNHP